MANRSLALFRFFVRRSCDGTPSSTFGSGGGGDGERGRFLRIEDRLRASDTRKPAEYPPDK